MSNTVNIIVFYYNDEFKITLSQNGAIEDLKHEIYRKLSVKPSKQIICGYNVEPQNDEALLKDCLDICNNEICLALYNTDDQNPIFTQQNNPYENCTPIKNNVSNHTQTQTNLQEVLSEPVFSTLNEEDADCDHDQIMACMNFKWKFVNNFTYAALKFEISPLRDFINMLIDKKSIGVLYFHNINDAFAGDFCRIINTMMLVEMFKNIPFLGWDIEDVQYHSALIRALQQFSDLFQATDLIESKTSCALILVPDNENKNITLCSCVKKIGSDKELVDIFQIASSLYGCEENDVEEESCAIGSTEYQKLMADMLGDRDYDSFRFDQTDQLKEKIAFALFGPPQNADTLDYDEKQKEDINKLYAVIKRESDLVAKWKDQVEISFIYNCTEPLNEEKQKRLKKYKDYDAKTDINPVPVFVLRKCHNSKNPCRVFIDHSGRVYNTWDGYLSKNKLHECVMVVPKNGRYSVNENEEVLLTKLFSPACDTGSKLLQVTDIGSTIGGVASGGIFVAAAIPAIAVAPAALIAGGVIGAGVGVYSIGRSIANIVDRRLHKESMSFAHSEARGAYLNILAGSLGFVGAGASLAVSQLASNGVNLGLGARAVFNTINIMNLSAGGISLANSMYDVVEQWFNGQTPSTLTLVQLSSSILFFGNAVYNFRSAGTIIEESQARTIQDYHESLRSNRHRKTFNKLMKSTMAEHGGDVVGGRAEVISTIKSFQNKDEVMAVLTRSNKMFNEKGVKVTASNGKINLNGIPIDIDTMTGFTKKDMGNVINNLKSYKTTITSSIANDIKAVKSNITSISFSDADRIIKITCKMFTNYNTHFKVYIAKALTALLGILQDKMIKTIKSLLGVDLYIPKMLDMILRFFLNQAKTLEEQYWKWKRTGNQSDYNPIFDYVKITPNSKKIINALQCILCRDFVNGIFVQDALKELIDYTHNWLASVIYKQSEETESNEQIRAHSGGKTNQKVNCDICNGHFYQPTQ